IRALGNENGHVVLGSQDVESAVIRMVVENEKVHHAELAVVTQEIPQARRFVMSKRHAKHTLFRDVRLRDRPNSDHARPSLKSGSKKRFYPVASALFSPVERVNPNEFRRNVQRSPRCKPKLA